MQDRGSKPRILVLEALSGASACVRRAGGTPIECSPWDAADVVTAFERGVDGLLLTGGGDVSPSRYGQPRHRTTYGVSECRDAVELWAIEQARERDIPVLGICRGMQLLAVESGGTLRQDIGIERGRRHHRRHRVVREAGSRFATLTHGCKVSVDSHHHQTVTGLAGFRVGAFTEDGLVESIESPDGRVLAVQGHPEMSPSAPYSIALFRWLVWESARRAGLPIPREQLRPARRKRGRVEVSWPCPRCGRVFDLLRDRTDHVHSAHGRVA